MCLIAVAPKGLKIPLSGLKVSAKRNKDGFGFMINGEHGTVIKKGFRGLTSMYRAYLTEFKENPNREFAIHLRKASVGGISAELSHPFTFGETGGLVHNGTIHGLGSTGKSDSMLLAKMLGDLPGWSKSKEMLSLIEEYVGVSRVVTFQDGELTVINGEGGMALDGIWYSNDSILVDSGKKDVTK